MREQSLSVYYARTKFGLKNKKKNIMTMETWKGIMWDGEEYLTTKVFFIT